MKKLLLSLGLAVGAFFSMSAETAEVTFSQLGYSNGQTVASVDVPNSPITIKPEKAGAGTAPSYYDTGSGLRIYAKGTMTVSVPDGYTLTKIVFTASSSSYAVKGTVDKGSLSVSNATSTWTGSAQNIVLTFAADPKHCRLQKMVFTYTAPAAAVENVEIGYTNTASTATVTLTCATDGATIYYGFSEDAITNEYTQPFTVNKHETVYAYAEKGADKSYNSSLDLPYFSCKEVLSAIEKEEVTLIGNYQVIYQAPKNYLLLTDGTSNTLVYGNSGTYPVGTKISKIEASVSPYHSLFELTDATLTEGGDGAEYTPAELITFEGLNYDDNLFDEVILKGCTISGKNGNNATIEIDGKSIPMYNNFGIEFENGENYEITGFVWRNYNDLQISPISVVGGSFVETVKTPVIAPNKRELMPQDDITITCATADAKIYYTTDGTEPDDTATLYDGTPIDFPDDAIDFTVKARAYKEGMLASEIAERKYHLFDAACNVITADNHEDSGNSYLPAHTCTIDRVDYQMVALHDTKQGIQMNNSSTRFCYLIQTSDNKGFVVGDGIEWVLSSIEIDYNKDDKNVSFNVRGSNTPFKASTTETANNTDDKASLEETGDFIGTISATNTSVDFTKNYRYFALYPATTGVVYINSITINYRRVQDSPRKPLTGAYLEADENTVQEQFEVFMGAYTADGDEIDFTGNVTVSVKDSEGKDVEEGATGFVYDIDGYLATVNIVNAGVYTVTMSWTGDLNYEDGSLSTELTVFSPVSIANQSEGVVYSCSATFQDGSEDTNGIPAFIFAEGARDHKIQLTAPAGAKLHYLAKEVSLSSPANAPKRVAGQDVPKGFTEHAGGEITLPGEHGIMQLVTEKNGVVSPVESAYYTNDADKLKEVTTGVAEVEIDNGIATYYDLQGRRVAADELKAGIYVRVAGKTVTKVLVK